MKLLIDICRQKRPRTSRLPGAGETIGHAVPALAPTVKARRRSGRQPAMDITIFVGEPDELY
jgi:hypothetical protein